MSFFERRNTMSKEKKTEMMAVSSGTLEFDYRALKPAQAEKLRVTAKGIRDKINKSLRGLIEAGQGLVAVKDLLPHGQFGPWLEAEFGWSDRTARRLMEVAVLFGSKTDILSDLAIPPTSLYLLAAPSTPFEARQTAIDRAQAGERITPAIVNEILASIRKVSPVKAKKTVPLDRLSQALRLMLRRFRDRFGLERAVEYAHQLHVYASDIEKVNGNQKVNGNRNGASSPNF
jgi:hypothetical protein